MSQYPGNSIKKRESEKKEIKPVAQAKTKKKSEFKKIASSIIAEESKSIKDYVIYDVLIPVVKDTITQVIKGSIDMLFYGEVRSSRSSSIRGGVNASRVSYRDYYEDKRERYDRRERDREMRVSYNDIVFDHKEDADEVLDRMDELVEQYGVVTVADLFELSGITGNGYTDQNYGWTSTRSASVERTRDGVYILKLQRPCNIR